MWILHGSKIGRDVIRPRPPKRDVIGTRQPSRWNEFVEDKHRHQAMVEFCVNRARGVEPADMVKTRDVTDDNGKLRLRVKTYVWPHDGPFNKMDYEPVMYFYNTEEDNPANAIAFSHYGLVYYKGLQPWDDSDYSPRFPNTFHTPVLKAQKIEIKDGILSRGALAAAQLGLLRNQVDVESHTIHEGGLPPQKAEIYPKVRDIVDNWEGYWFEF